MQIETALIGDYIQCYSGYANNKDIRYNASSGGLITALLVFALENNIIDGAVVVRYHKDNVFLSEAYIARSREEIIASSKSRYCPSVRTACLNEILLSKKEERLAFVGLPCHIKGITKAMQINPELKKRIVLIFGLFCGGTPSVNGLRFFAERNNIKEKDIEKISFRGEGWPGVVKFFKKNKEIMSFSFPFFWSIAGSSFFIQESCFACHDCTAEDSDLSFGDPWIKEFRNDRIGNSLVVCRTKAGSDLLGKAQAARAIELTKIIPDNVVLSQLTNIYLKKMNPKMLSWLLKLNCKIGSSGAGRKILYFIPLGAISLYIKVLGKICHKMAWIKIFSY